jgi:hypothetical protein
LPAASFWTHLGLAHAWGIEPFPNRQNQVAPFVAAPGQI